VNLKELGVRSALLSDTQPAGSLEEQHGRRHVPIVTGFARSNGYGRFHGVGWTVLVRLDRQHIVGPLQADLRPFALFALGAWIGAASLLLWTVYRLKQEWVHVTAVTDQLRTSDAQTRAVIETALDAVVVMDASGFVREWNEQAVAVFGWTRVEAMGKRLSDLIIPPEYRDAHERGIGRFLATGKESVLQRRIEIIGQRRNGTLCDLELAICPVRQGDSYTFSGFMRDITQEKRGEKHQSALLAISIALNEADELANAADAILRAFCETVGWDFASIWLVDRDSATLRCLNCWQSSGLAADEFDTRTQGITFRHGEGLPGRVWQGREPLWITDVRMECNFPRASAAASAGLHGAVAFPIVGMRGVHGVVECLSRASREPDGDLLQMMKDVGIRIGQFLERHDADLERKRLAQELTDRKSTRLNS